MDATKTLMIRNIVSNVLAVQLSEILNCIPDGDHYSWSLLWINAIGNPDDLSVLDFEKKINKSVDGFMLDWKGLEELSGRFNQIIELVVIGDQDKANLHRYSTDEEMYEKCCYTLELVDSSYWLVNTKNENTIRKMKSELVGVTDS